MAEQWYYTKNGQPMDPVPLAELKRLASAGDLKPNDLVWKEGMPNWVKASTTKELFADDASASATTAKPAAPARKSQVAEVDKEEWDTGDNGKRRHADADDVDDAPQPVRKRSAARQVEDDEWDDGDSPRRARRFADHDELDDDDRPRRRKRKKQPQGMGGGAVFGLIGGGVVLLAIVIGVIAGIATSLGGGAMEGSYNWSLNTGEKTTYSLRLQAGNRVELRVHSTGQSDVDMFVYEGDNKIRQDEGASSDCFLSFTPASTRTYRVEVANRQLIGPPQELWRNGHNSGTFTYKQIKPGDVAANNNVNNNVPPPPQQKAPDPAPFMGQGNQLDFNVTGNLNRSERKKFNINLDANTTYTVDLRSAAFDAYLEIENAAGQILGVDDDSGGDLNSRLVFRPPQSGMYRIVVRALPEDPQPGPFTLTVRH